MKIHGSGSMIQNGNPDQHHEMRAAACRTKGTTQTVVSGQVCVAECVIQWF